MNTITDEVEIEKFITNCLSNNPYLKESDIYKAKKEIYSYLEEKDFEGFLLQFDNITKLDAFLLIKNLIPKRKQAVKLFKEIWTLAEIQYKRSEDFKKLFIEYRNDIMSKNEITYYDNLPEMATIYRGTRVSPEIDSGISWTTDKEVAEKFLTYSKGIYHELQLDGQDKKLCPNLRTKEVNKKDIICCLKNRKENEIIYWVN